jgi:hypothetical protein
MLRWIVRLAFIGAVIALALTFHLEVSWELALGSQVIAVLAGYLVGMCMRSRSCQYLYGMSSLVLLLLLSFWSSADLTLMLATGYGYAAGLVLEGLRWQRHRQTRSTHPFFEVVERV